MDQCSQLSIEFDRLGLTDLLEGISVAGDRFYLVEHLFASGKVNQEYRNGAPGPAMNCLPFLGHKKWEAFLWLETLCTTSG